MEDILHTTRQIFFCSVVIIFYFIIRSNWSDRHITQNLKFELFFCSILSCDGDLHHFENSDNYQSEQNEIPSSKFYGKTNSQS